LLKNGVVIGQTDKIQSGEAKIPEGTGMSIVCYPLGPASATLFGNYFSTQKLSIFLFFFSLLVVSFFTYFR